MSDDKTLENGKWWEFYFVRYFVGTVTGMGLVAFLNFDSNSPLQGKILPNLTDITSLDFAHATVLGAIGLAFCYVSSAPILTMHAFRGMFTSRWSDESRLWCCKYGNAQIVVLVTIFAVLVFANIQIYDVLFPCDKNRGLNIFSMSGLSLAFGLQLCMIFSSLVAKKNYITEYYQKLSKERTKKTDTKKPQKEYIESYKHLREHGNAFFILLFEMVFTLALYSVENPIYSVIILLVWIAPSCFIWVLGTRLELSLDKLENV